MGLLEDLAGFRPTPPVEQTVCQFCNQRLVKDVNGEWVLYWDPTNLLCDEDERIPHIPFEEIEDQEDEDNE